ncbi:hypothetical protein ABIB87_009020 [Bradyrhizobium sp. JR18.2]
MVSPSLTLRTDVQLAHMPAKQARGRLSSSANQMSPPSGPEERYSRANQTYVSNVLKTLPQHIQPEVWI